MKFARLLRATVRDLPEMQELLTCYKDMKKLLKGVSANEGDAEASSANASQMEAQFVQSLYRHLSGFNSQWVEREERFVMRLHAMQERVAVASDLQTKLALHKQLLDFHGESLLMMHWSMLAYTGLVKIMKKYKKRTGKLLDAPHLKDLLSQPFCSTEVMSSLVTSVERSLRQLSVELGLPVAVAHPDDNSARPRVHSASGQRLGADQMGAGGSDPSLNRSSAFVTANDTGASSPTHPFASAGSAIIVQAPVSKRPRTSQGNSAFQMGKPRGESCTEPENHTAQPATDGAGPDAADAIPPLAVDRPSSLASAMLCDTATPGRGSPAQPAGVRVAEATSAAEGAAGATEQRHGGDLGSAAAASSPQVSADDPADDDDDDEDDESDEDDEELRQLMVAASSAQPNTGLQADSSGAAAMMKKTRLALSTWRHLQRASNTPSTVLPAAKRHRSAGPGQSCSSRI